MKTTKTSIKIEEKVGMVVKKKAIKQEQQWWKTNTRRHPILHHYLRCYTNEFGWRARTVIEVIKWRGAWPKEALHVKFCGQDVVRRSQGALVHSEDRTELLKLTQRTCSVAQRNTGLVEGAHKTLYRVVADCHMSSRCEVIVNIQCMFLPIPVIPPDDIFLICWLFYQNLVQLYVLILLLQFCIKWHN